VSSINENGSGGSQGRNSQGFDRNGMGEDGNYCRMYDENTYVYEEKNAFLDDIRENTGMDYMYIKIHIFICICMYTYIYMLIYTYIYVCMYLYIYEFLYVHMCNC
jgi:hypothetical protein